MQQKDYESDLVDLTMVLHAWTQRAIRVSDTGENEDAKWLPLSQIEVAEAQDTWRRGTKIIVTLPEWLAKKEGLI
jgi:hypothetical protein